jgi:hypothetical protein
MGDKTNKQAIHKDGCHGSGQGRVVHIVARDVGFGGNPHQHIGDSPICVSPMPAINTVLAG